MTQRQARHLRTICRSPAIERRRLIYDQPFFVDMTDQGVPALASVGFEIAFVALLEGMDAAPASDS